jgi:hypothetical protein
MCLNPVQAKRTTIIILEAVVVVIICCWIYNYLCNQYLSPLTLWVWILLKRNVLDTTLCDKFCQWLPTGRWFSPGTPVSSIYKKEKKEENRHSVNSLTVLSMFNVVHPAPSFSFLCSVCRPLFVLCFFFFWPLWCLSFNIRLLNYPFHIFKHLLYLLRFLNNSRQIRWITFSYIKCMQCRIYHCA